MSVCRCSPFLIGVICLAANLLVSCVDDYSVYVRLSEIDDLLQTDPEGALESICLINSNSLRGREKAYYGLLQTIALHKNQIPFTSDSTIAESREWYEKHNDDFYNQARSFFYHGLALHLLSKDDAYAYQLMLRAMQIIDSNAIKDDRLTALVCAYLGKINDTGEYNPQEAVRFYRKAIEAEQQLGNTRNLILDVCDLLICLVKGNDTQEAPIIKAKLDSLLEAFPTIKLEKPNNANTIYYLYFDNKLDSALFYCRKWHPSSADSGAKDNLLAGIYRRKNQPDSAIFYEKASLSHIRLKDKMARHVYYRHLADDYNQLGNADSSAHYARLAYEALKDQQDKRTEKRILELEKKYDVASREIELERTRRDRDIAVLLLFFALIAITLLLWNKRLLHKNNELRRREGLKDAFAKTIIQSVVTTYSGVNQRLAIIHNLPDKERQAALNKFIQDNKYRSSANLLSALEKSNSTLPEHIQQVASSLEGAQQKTVFILTELGFTPAEIGKMLGISSSHVRMVKTVIRDRILDSELGNNRSIHQLQVMQLGSTIAPNK